MQPQKRPARIGFLLAQLGAHAADLFTEQLREIGITSSEAGVIRILARTPGMTQRELATKSGATQSRVVVLIDGLERKGLALRTRSETDRRIQHLDLTDAGRALLPSLRRAAEAQEAALTDRLTPEQKNDLYELLSALSGGLDLDRDVHPGYRDNSRD
ncbi:MarR family winged helix-turn-helix transcriptional regulator [Tsukamurella soli]|uniref:HTH marR-type domain-containing protein n=1 Tax=Tsukamurella soli TaxID=644556 RepID=A0ABP8JXK8_9ACTN